MVGFRVMTKKPKMLTTKKATTIKVWAYSLNHIAFRSYLLIVAELRPANMIEFFLYFSLPVPTRTRDEGGRPWLFSPEVFNRTHTVYRLVIVKRKEPWKLFNKAMHRPRCRVAGVKTKNSQPLPLISGLIEILWSGISIIIIDTQRLPENLIKN